MQSLLSFIEKSKNPYHAVKTIKDKLESEGFTYLSERKVWDIKGGKYYTVRNNSSIIAFTVPENGKIYFTAANWTNSTAFSAYIQLVSVVEAA